MKKMLLLTLLISSLIGTSESYSSTCADFTENLRKCEPYSCSFKHPFTGGMMKRQIVGLKNNVCQYVEEMPNNGKMECLYPLERLDAVADAYKKAFAQFESGNINFSAKFSLGDSSAETEGSGNDNNALQKYLDDGTCVVTGY